MKVDFMKKNPTGKVENPPEEGPVESALSGGKVDVVQNSTSTAGPHQFPLVRNHWKDLGVGILILPSVEDVAAGQLLVKSILIIHLGSS